MLTGKEARREIVLRVREEGRQAAFFGKRRQANPYNPRLTMDHYQWNVGFTEAIDAVARSASTER